MSILKTLFSNESLKKSIFKTFIDKMKENNVDALIIYLNDKNEIDLKPLQKNEIVVLKDRYYFYLDFFTKNKNLLNDTK